MKEQIKQVQDYFKSKLLTKDFEIKKIEAYTMQIIIDGQFAFNIWIGNIDTPSLRYLYKDAPNFIDLQLTKSECETLHNLVVDDVKKYIKETLIAEKIKELEQFQKEML